MPHTPQFKKQAVQWRPRNMSPENPNYTLNSGRSRGSHLNMAGKPKECGAAYSTPSV